MYNLYFLDYNTYGNRLVKKEASLSDYLTYEVARETSANFNINDGVNAVAVVNKAVVGNYLLVTDSNGVFHSRWFIMENQYKRNGQHFVTLKRDLMVDYWDKIITAPCFIEKATLNDNDPLIFNNENMTFNQIKTSETPLKDQTGCPWIVGYYARKDGSDNTTELSGTSEFDFPHDIEIDGDITTWEYYSYLSNQFIANPYQIDYYTYYERQTIFGLYVPEVTIYSHPKGQTGSHVNEQLVDTETDFKLNSILVGNFGGSLARKLQNDRDTLDSLSAAYLPNHNENETNSLLSLSSKIIRTYDNGEYKYYRISVNAVGNIESGLIDITSGSLFNNMVGIFNELKLSYDLIGTPASKTYKINSMAQAYQLSISQLSNVELSYNITSSRYHLMDSPYDMFAIPYSDDLVIKNTGDSTWQNITANKNIAFNIAMAIASKYNGTFLYDIQLLPYCPIRNIITNNNEVDIANDNLIYSKIENDGTVYGVIFNSSASTFSFDIQLDNPITITNPKIESLTDKYRLCSPNYNGLFEFNAAKNGGVSRFNVDCSYLPYNPYIHINPDFSLLYGADFDDSRGLICAGDFSLPVANSAWETYKIQNKNYENIFNRQIQNMEINNTLGNIRTGVGALGSAIGTGLSTGSVIAGVASAIGGAADLGLQIAQQQETLDFTKDLFGYQLGNVQALPDSLSKTTAYTANNKIFPFLEYYTCTDEEKQALRDKITYNGMTVMRIGKIEDYLKDTMTYIKGQIIRLEVDDDNHLLEAIRQEVNKGVYV